MIVLSNLAKSYDGGRTFAVSTLNLTIERGELLILLGESGCGKTTTLKMINRLIEPTAGSIEIDGEPAHAIDPVLLRRRIGYIFQGVGLFPHMTVGENVAIVPRLLKWTAREIDQRVNELLELVNLPGADYRDRLPRHLSGGQRQRVGVARALAARPKIMLMDEPFGALDPLTRETLQAEYRRIHQSLGLTSIMVTHDMTEALLMADRIAVMHHGRIAQLGTPHEMLSNPQTDHVRTLMQAPRQHAEKLDALMTAGRESTP